MAHTRTRTVVMRGIYRDKFGIAIIVSVHGKPLEFRKNEHGKPYSQFPIGSLGKERDRIKARELLKMEHVTEQGENFAADITRYLKVLSGRTKDDAANLLSHWKMFGNRDRRRLTALELRQHAATWTCAASTFNHRRQALISLYKALDGPSAPNPAREIPKRKEHQGAPKALPYDVIRDALERMPECDEKAWLTLMAYTGLPQTQMKALTDTDWQRQRLRVTPRRKGAGTSGRWIPLAPEAMTALTYIQRHQLWGTLDRYKLYRVWEDHGPKGSNPYSLRHSWITELYRRSNGDVLAVKNLALHSMLTQTERYAAAALDDRMAALVVPRKRATKSWQGDSNFIQNAPPKPSAVKRRPTREKTTKSAKSRRK